MLSAICTHVKAPYKTDLLWKTLRAIKRPGRPRTALIVSGRSMSPTTRLRTDGPSHAVMPFLNSDTTGLNSISGLRPFE
jgi:hypothetical protein